MRTTDRSRTHGLGAAAAVALATAAALTASPARAEPLAADDIARLVRGETLVFEKTVVNDTHRYVGGVTYTLVHASPDELATLLEDTRAYRELLPRTKNARRVLPPAASARSSTAHTGAGSLSGSRDFFVELRQGNALMEAVYTLHVRKLPEASTFKFWLDPRMPHGIDDAWGFFRYEPVPEAARVALEAASADAPFEAPGALFTYGVLVDVGPGIVREFFEEKVRAILLSVPQLVRSYVQNNVRTAKKT